MKITELSQMVSAKRSRDILARGLRMQFDNLDERDINYEQYAKEIQAVAFKYALIDLVNEIENDI